MDPYVYAQGSSIPLSPPVERISALKQEFGQPRRGTLDNGSYIAPRRAKGLELRISQSQADSTAPFQAPRRVSGFPNLEL